MRRDNGSREAEEAAHPGAVVRERTLLQDCQRERQILSEHIPALLANPTDRKGLDPARHAFNPMIEEKRIN